VVERPDRVREIFEAVHRLRRIKGFDISRQPLSLRDEVLCVGPAQFSDVGLHKLYHSFCLRGDGGYALDAVHLMTVPVHSFIPPYAPTAS
jgi:hypothetical protein